MRYQPGKLSYALTFGLLVLLASLSLALALTHVGGLAAALVIAAAKATLVITFFMHLVRARPPVRLALLVVALFAALLIGLTALDVATRHTAPPRPSPAEGQPFYRR